MPQQPPVSFRSPPSKFRAPAFLPVPLSFNEPVLTYNRQTGWNESGTETVRAHFRSLTCSELLDLQPGDLVWIDQDPLSPAGKVYGRMPRVVTSVTIDKEREEIKIHFGKNGFTTRSLNPERGRTVETVEDLDALAAYAHEHPLCLRVW